MTTTLDAYLSIKKEIEKSNPSNMSACKKMIANFENVHSHSPNLFGELVEDLRLTFKMRFPAIKEGVRQKFPVDDEYDSFSDNVNH